MIQPADRPTHLGDPRILRPVLRLLAASVLLGSLGQAPVPAATLSSFDAVAFKYDTGESVSEVLIGVEAVPAPVLDAAVNFLLVDRVAPLYLTAGPSGGGVVAFGYVDSNVWTPSDGDGKDLVDASVDTGHRVYATVDASGTVRLVSAAPLAAGVELGSTTVTLDPDKPWRLDLDVASGLASVYYGPELVLEGIAFGQSGMADQASIGDDLAISVLVGPTQTGQATLNDLARNPTITLDGFPRVLPHRGTDPVFAAPRTADILLVGERADIVLYFLNEGSATASNVTVELVPPAGVGLSVVASQATIAELAPAVSTPRAFVIESAPSTPVGTYPFTVNLTGGVTATLEAWVPIWDLDTSFTDVVGGVGTVTGTTPFNTFSLDVVNPEVWTGGRPDYFDPQSLDATVTHEVPFRGTNWSEAVLVPAPAPSPLRATSVIGKVVLRDKMNMPVTIGSDATVVLLTDKGALVKAVTPDAAGNFNFGFVSPGGYKLLVLLPPALRKLYGLVVSAPFEVGTETIKDLGEVTVSAPPPKAQGEILAPPPSGQGQTGTKTQPPPPPPRNPPPPKKGRGSRSVLFGFATGVLADVGDLFLAGGSGGATLASIFASNAIGAAAGVAFDPVDEDLLYVGRLNTPPVDPGERTLSEDVTLSVDVDPPLSLTAPSTISTTYTYTRNTDADSYPYSSGEALTFDKYVPLVVNTAPSGNDLLVTVEPTTASGEPLSGSEVLVQAWMLAGDDNTLVGTTYLRDDGQPPDATAGDGIHSGTISRNCTSGMKLYVFASRSGFVPENWPSSFGAFTADVVPGPVCPSGLLFEDDFESAGTKLWSRAVGAP